MSRLLWWIVGVPVGIVLVALAVANRKPVVVSLDPFNAAAPALALPVPLFLLVFGALILGVVLGGVAAWASQRGAPRPAPVPGRGLAAARRARSSARRGGGAGRPRGRHRPRPARSAPRRLIPGGRGRAPRLPSAIRPDRGHGFDARRVAIAPPVDRTNSHAQHFR
ncbi:DUF1049 domain-containing protein [Methyloraptor flagellatus]|uniref:DUF1049 domain-containing protein n=1 Tax=Methyloraptor flagellatus TaxID=3162530 RepID=A0AAU7X901_9HYPH